MDIFEVQNYIVIKLLLLFFISAAIYIIAKKKSPKYFLILTGAVSALAYYFLMRNLGLSLWGLQGDEITITAMYQTFAHSVYSDFAYHGLAPFYPSAWFFVFGMIGRIFDWNGIQIAKLASMVFFLIFPISIYILQKKLTINTAIANKKIFLLLSPLLIITILDKDLLLGKPYEIIAAAATIIWYISIYIKLTTGKWNFKQLIIHSVLAGLIFMVYYLWLVFAALAIILLVIFDKFNYKFKVFLSLVKTMALSLLVASPFIIPLVLNYLRFGSESWQTAFFTPTGLNLWAPWFQFNSFNSLILLFGLASLIYYRKELIAKQLLYLFSTAFLWWALGMLSLLILHKPFQEFRGFYVLAPSILAFGAAHGFSQLINHFDFKNKPNTTFTVSVLAVLYFSTQSIFGFFVDDPVLKMRLIESRELSPAITDLKDYLGQDQNSAQKLTLQTVPQLLAFTPINHLIYFNQHNNHPSAIFSQRFAYVNYLADSESSEELFNRVIDCPYGDLERFIFYKDKDSYYLYFHLDKIIVGIEEKELIFPQELFAGKHFNKVYDKDSYVIIDVVR